MCNTTLTHDKVYWAELLRLWLMTSNLNPSIQPKPTQHQLVWSTFVSWTLVLIVWNMWKRKVNQLKMLDHKHKLCTVGYALCVMEPYVYIGDENEVHHMPQVRERNLQHGWLDQIVILSHHQRENVLKPQHFRRLHSKIGPNRPLNAQVLGDDVEKNLNSNSLDDDHPHFSVTIHIQ